MSPRFDFNPAEAVSGIPTYLKGSYEFVLGEPVSFYRPGKDGKEDNYGVFFKAKCVEGDMKDKPYIVSCYQHNDDSRNFSKAVQMAALGFIPKKQDKEFDAAHSGDDWTFNTDDKSCGDGWHKMKGQHIIQDFDTPQPNPTTGDLQSKTLGVRPLG